MLIFSPIKNTSIDQIGNLYKSLVAEKDKVIALLQNKMQVEEIKTVH